MGGHFNFRFESDLSYFNVFPYYVGEVVVGQDGAVSKHEGRHGHMEADGIFEPR